MNEEIVYNTLKDWSKKEIPAEVKSVFIKDFLRKEKISMRELGRRIGVPHSTLQDWVSMRQTRKKALIQEKIFRNEVFHYADRLTYLLSKGEKIDEKAKQKLLELRVFLELIK